MNDEKSLLGKIKFFHRPDQKGSRPDYWVAIYKNNLTGSETKEEAKQNLLNTLKELN